ncbi:hypothetical protein ACFL7M_01650 [Thermodesulfobacteriota bacterium]
MKKNTLLILISVPILSLMLLVNPVFAGNTQRHRWEGVAIGIGAAILGSTVYHYSKHHSNHRPVTHHGTVRDHSPRRHHRHWGHWEVRKERVPPTYKRVWNPGHYNRRGEWISGHWIEIMDKPGCWTEKRVWVTRR